jgi:hypothetical protein
MGTRSGSVLSTTGGLVEDRTMMGRLEPDGKTVASTADYGRCTCGGVFEKRFVEIQMGPAERKVVWRGMAQGACPNCGARVYKMFLLELIETRYSGIPK